MYGNWQPSFWPCCASRFSARPCRRPKDRAAAEAGGGGGGGGGDIPDYGDLIILYRDVDGVPIPSPAVLVTDPETGELVDGGLCWQPIAFRGRRRRGFPLAAVRRQWLPVYTDDRPGIPVESVHLWRRAAGARLTQEADFGRMNDARAPDTVFESQLADAVVSLATADCITLDPAGRMVHSRVDDDIVVSKTIDSPLQNLAIYRQLMLNGRHRGCFAGRCGRTRHPRHRGQGTRCRLRQDR